VDNFLQALTVVYFICHVFEPPVQSVLIFQTQVCVLQTTMDLLERNYNVHVLADGVSSRTMVERMFALEVTLGWLKVDHCFCGLSSGINQYFTLI